MDHASLVAVAHFKQKQSRLETIEAIALEVGQSSLPVCSSWYTRNIFISSRTTASGVNLQAHKRVRLRLAVGANR
jgi:hypothetical protein